MAVFLDNYNLFLNYISRRTPCIMCFFDPSDDNNQSIVNKVNKVCRSFPYVLCYISDWMWFHCYPTQRNYLRSDFVYEFINGRSTMAANGNSNREIRVVFDYVFQECLHFHFSGWLRLLKLEKNITQAQVTSLIAQSKTTFNPTKPILTPHHVSENESSSSIEFNSFSENIKKYDEIQFSKPTEYQRKLFLERNSDHNYAAISYRNPISHTSPRSPPPVIQFNRVHIPRLSLSSSHSKQNNILSESTSRPQKRNFKRFYPYYFPQK